jgi:RimJ/RimL family protein N-acetyltransferase
MKIHEIRTPRLLLRNWEESDSDHFIAMGQDTRVMEYFPSLLTQEQSREFIRKTKEGFAERGWGLWAAEDLASSAFIGFIGIKLILEEFPVKSIQSPPVEIGWRLKPEWWNQGLATEGALACLKLGFETLEIREIISFTSLLNTPSIRVMQKIGMTRNIADDFDHPRVPQGDKLRKHVVYRMTKEDWQKK